MKLTETIITMMLKRGLEWEGRNVDVSLDIPRGEDTPIQVRIKAENMTITVDKEEKNG